MTEKDCPALKPIDTSKDIGEAKTTAGWANDRAGHASCYRAAWAESAYLDKLDHNFGAVKPAK